MIETLRMGGDAAYVWSAYGITLALLIFNVWWARWRHRQALQKARVTAVAQVHKRPTVRQVQ